MSSTAPRASRDDLASASKVRVHLQGQASRVFDVWGVEANELFLMEGETDYKVSMSCLEVRDPDAPAVVDGIYGMNWEKVGHVEGIEVLE